MNAIQKFIAASADPELQGPEVIGEPKLGSLIKHLGRFLSYQARTRSGKVLDYNKLVTETPGWAVVAGLTREGILLTQANYKPGVNRVEWSLAPGGLGRMSPDISPQELLPRVQEGYLRETGFGGGTWLYMQTETIHSGLIRGSSPDAHGLWAHMYMAFDLERLGESNPNVSETIRIIPVPLAEIADVIDSGFFDEASSLSCLLLAERRLRKLGLLS